MRRATIVVVLAVLLATVVAGWYAGRQAGGAPPGVAKSTFVVAAPASPIATPARVR